MTYTNPPNSFIQDQLAVHENTDSGEVFLYEKRPLQPWELNERQKKAIVPGEVTITYVTHACMELKFNNFTMFFDPWLTGPAFLRRWWLLHEPPADCLDRLAKADAIYISHLQSDHLSYETLELLSELGVIEKKANYDVNAWYMGLDTLWGVFRLFLIYIGKYPIVLSVILLVLFRHRKMSVSLMYQLTRC